VGAQWEATKTGRGAWVPPGGEALAFGGLIARPGFHPAEAGAPFPVTGRGGRGLDAAWGDAATAYLGTTVHGFPNLFLMSGPNTGLGHNSVIGIIEAQATYVLDALATLSQRPGQAFDVRADVQRDYNTWLQSRLANTVWNTGGCASWYLTRAGINTTLWPGFSAGFAWRLRRFGAGAYARAAQTLGISQNAVAASVRRLRLRCRGIILAEIMETVESREEAEEELRALFHS